MSAEQTMSIEAIQEELLKLRDRVGVLTTRNNNKNNIQENLIAKNKALKEEIEHLKSEGGIDIALIEENKKLKGQVSSLKGINKKLQDELNNIKDVSLASKIKSKLKSFYTKPAPEGKENILQHGMVLFTHDPADGTISYNGIFVIPSKNKENEILRVLGIDPTKQRNFSRPKHNAQNIAPELANNPLSKSRSKPRRPHGPKEEIVKEEVKEEVKETNYF